MLGVGKSLKSAHTRRVPFRKAAWIPLGRLEDPHEEPRLPFPMPSHQTLAQSGLSYGAEIDMGRQIHLTGRRQEVVGYSVLTVGPQRSRRSSGCQKLLSLQPIIEGN